MAALADGIAKLEEKRAELDAHECLDEKKSEAEAHKRDTGHKLAVGETVVTKMENDPLVATRNGRSLIEISVVVAC